MTDEERAYHELCQYTLLRGDTEFIHQYVVDAWQAQTAAAGDKPIGLAFALVGLFLSNEQGFSGRQIQKAHMKLGRLRLKLPTLTLPETRGSIRCADVLDSQPGPDRDEAIRGWSQSVWSSFTDQREAIAAWLDKAGYEFANR